MLLMEPAHSCYTCCPASGIPLANLVPTSGRFINASHNL
ncbi:hypothetical protein SLEP1_g18963 [Rubroshorea leprosula]|uniref:Uncharacterized protein n=1 Tax=Rubroshorea leprosula TaxID=152421 RepID=A0AAV5IZ72_9ROSI|nr:hypothetical protein SLEP1_g18963 [Rubroshorea leprosula]